MCSGSFDDDLGDYLRDGLASVHRLFQPGIQLTPFDEAENISRAVVEQSGIGHAVDHIGFVFQASYV